MKTLSKQDLLMYIDRMREAILDNDSFEGYVRYEQENLEEYQVDMCFRIGNSLGQGGVIFLQTEKFNYVNE